MLSSGATRVRTCVGCRARVPAEGLLRVVVDDGVLIPDPTATRRGRGAWLHLDCWEAAERRKAFRRALRVEVAPDTRVLREFVAGNEPNRTADQVVRRTDGALRG